MSFDGMDMDDDDIHHDSLHYIPMQQQHNTGSEFLLINPAEEDLYIGGAGGHRQIACRCPVWVVVLCFVFPCLLGLFAFVLIWIL